MDLSSVVMSPHLAIPMRTQTRKCQFEILRLCSIAVASAFAVKHIRSYHPRRRSKPRAYRSRTTSTVCPRPRLQSPRSRIHEARRAYSVQSSMGTMRCAPPHVEFHDPSPKYRSLNLRSNPSRSYAFVEFRSTRDAEDAYYDMYVCCAMHYVLLTRGSVRQAWTAL